MPNTTIEPYAALPLQVTCQAINQLPDRGSARQSMHNTVDRLHRQIRASKAFIGNHVRLVVLPEYFLTGFPMGDTLEGWQHKAALEEECDIYDKLAHTASENKVYLSGNSYEVDPNFSDLYFQTSFIFNDSGDLILRYRRLISMFAPTPHDVLDKYLDLYGLDGLFPVANTELGRLACVASEEILYPEITRALTMRGAEVICHSSSEIASPAATPKNTAKSARAYENHCYVVSANSAGITGTDMPAASADGSSRVVDFQGQVIAQADTGESMAAYADLNIEQLRHYRRRPSMFNTLSRQRFELFSSLYSDNSVYPANTLLHNGDVQVPERSHFLQKQAEVIERLTREGII